MAFGQIMGMPDGIARQIAGQGVDPDLREAVLCPGGTMSIREFIVGALNDEMGMQVADPELISANQGGRIVTPSGMVLDGTPDQPEGPAGDTAGRVILGTVTASRTRSR